MGHLVSYSHTYTDIRESRHGVNAPLYPQQLGILELLLSIKQPGHPMFDEAMNRKLKQASLLVPDRVCVICEPTIKPLIFRLGEYV